MDPADRDRVLTRVREYLRRRPETSGGEFTVPLVTLVLRTAREDADTGTAAGR
jgi:hypothetical protein